MPDSALPGLGFAPPVTHRTVPETDARSGVRRVLGLACLSGAALEEGPSARDATASGVLAGRPDPCGRNCTEMRNRPRPCLGPHEATLGAKRKTSLAARAEFTPERHPGPDPESRRPGGSFASDRVPLESQLLCATTRLRVWLAGACRSGAGETREGSVRSSQPFAESPQRRRARGSAGQRAGSLSVAAPL